MNKINPIFEALSDVDERHFTVTQEKRHTKKLKIALIAAAAAVLMLIVGFSIPRTKSYGKYKFYYGISANDFIVFDLTPQTITFPEDLVFEDWLCSGKLETISDVCETFGITPIVNDNFTVGDRYNRCIEYNAFDADGLKQSLIIDYYLYDRNLGDYIRLESTHESDVNFAETNDGGRSYDNVEIITLKDSSSCVLTDICAHFSNAGARYSIDLSYGEKPHTRNDVKQVLADLGVL